VSYRYPETLADDAHAQRKPPRPHVDAEVRRRARTVCRHIVAGTVPGELSTNCQNKPADDGWCEEHRP
jgi:hypothetical protein